MRDRYLVLDCDGVIFDSLELIDKEVRKINYKASDYYLRKLLASIENLRKKKDNLELERVSDLSEIVEIDRLINKGKFLKDQHFDYKDQVLEEVYRKYQNLIDYRNIYQMKNTYPGIIKLILFLIKAHIYKKIFILSHCNVDNEVIAKQEFFDEYLPMVQFIPVRFHSDPYFNETTGKRNVGRKRSNKIEYFKDVTGIRDLSNVTFLDDTTSIYEEAIKARVGYCYLVHKDDNIVELLGNMNISFYNYSEKYKGKVYRKK